MKQQDLLEAVLQLQALDAGWTVLQWMLMQFAAAC